MFVAVLLFFFFLSYSSISHYSLPRVCDFLTILVSFDMMFLLFLLDHFIYRRLVPTITLIGPTLGGLSLQDALECSLLVD